MTISATTGLADPRVSADPTAEPCQDSALGRWHYYTENTPANESITATTPGEKLMNPRKPHPGHRTGDEKRGTR